MKKEHTLRAQLGPFGMVPLWVILACGEDSNAVHVYAILMARWADRQGVAFPDVALIAATIQKSARQVERGIARLRGVGALQSRLRHRAGDGAVIGREFVLIQIDPASLKAPSLPATDGKKAKSADTAVLPATDGTKAAAILPDADGTKAAPGLPATDGTKASRLPDMNGGAFLPPVSCANKEEPDPLNQIQERLSTAPPPTGAADRVRTLLDDYHDAFVARFHEPPQISGGKDGKLLKELATTHSADRVRELLAWFFRTPDGFISRTGYSVGVFHACFNKLLTTYRPAEALAGEAKHAALLEEIRARAARLQEAREREARDGLIALPPDVRVRLKQRAAEEFALARHRAGMSDEVYERTVRLATVRYVVARLAAPGQPITEALARFAEAAA